MSLVEMDFDFVFLGKGYLKEGFGLWYDFVIKTSLLRLSICLVIPAPVLELNNLLS